jgi:hypothetical protein
VPTLLVFTLGAAHEALRHPLLPWRHREEELRLRHACLEATLEAGRRAGCRLEVSSPSRLDVAQDEIRHCEDFDYVIINQDFASAVDDLAAIVRSARLRGAQQRARYRKLIQQLT